MDKELTTEGCKYLLDKLRKIIGERNLPSSGITIDIIESNDWSLMLRVPTSCGRESDVFDVVQMALIECSVKEEDIAYLGLEDGNFDWYFTHPEIPPEVRERIDAEVIEDARNEREAEIVRLHNNGISIVPTPNRQKSKADTVYLVLSVGYFNDIANGKKDTEYRDLTQYYADKLLGKEKPIRYVKLQDGYGGKGKPTPRKMVFEVKDIVLADDYKQEFPAYTNGNPTTDRDLPAAYLPTMYGIKLGKRIDFNT